MGAGPRRLLILNDWLCDTSTWQGARAYLDSTRFSWGFTDLRGYGRSRGRSGDFGILEAAGDVLAVADALAWPRFSVLGHSMSTYVAMHLGQHSAERIERVVLVTPGPPRGFGADAAWLEAAQASALDDERRIQSIRQRFAGRLSQGWGEYKAQRWLATADAEAAAGYIAMFARDGLPSPTAPIAASVLAITGEEDARVMRKAACLEHLAPICPTLEVIGLSQCGHYPMEEMPPLTVSLIERFCGGH